MDKVYVVKRIIGYVLLFISGIVLIRIVSNNVCTVNVKNLLKQDLFLNENENVNNSKIKYESTFEQFESYILDEKYNEAYELIDKDNADEKFGDVETFEEKLVAFYKDYYDKRFEIKNTVEKDEYKDTYITVTVNDEFVIEIKTIELMIREYNDSSYKIYFLTELE